ncbi:MAG: hypothetical protein L0099_08480 [Acidobacteria bacterium]|nr:hypothetical protein [Acidobacteriota bacterium]
MQRDFLEDRGGQHGAPIQVLSPTGVNGETAIDEATATNRIGPFPSPCVVSLWASVTCRFQMGDATVTVAADDATAEPLTAGQREFYRMPPGVTHIAARSRPAQGAGIFHGRELV